MLQKQDSVKQPALAAVLQLVIRDFAVSFFQKTFLHHTFWNAVLWPCQWNLSNPLFPATQKAVLLDLGSVHYCNRWYLKSQLHLRSCLIAKVSVHQAVPGTCAQTNNIDSIVACECRLTLHRLVGVWCITCL